MNINQNNISQSIVEELDSIFKTESDNFLDLMVIAGLDPKKDLRKADLQFVNLNGITLEYADLSYADLTGASLKGAHLRGSSFQKAIFRDTDLTDANLSEANLAGSDLRSANLTNTIFSGANLEGALLDKPIKAKSEHQKRIVIASSNHLLNIGISRLLPGMVIAEAKNVSEAIEMVRDINADVLILDSGSHEIALDEILRRLQENKSSVRIMILNVGSNTGEIMELNMRAGDYLFQDKTLDIIANSVRGIYGK